MKLRVGESVFVFGMLLRRDVVFVLAQQLTFNYASTKTTNTQIKTPTHTDRK